MWLISSETYCVLQWKFNVEFYTGSLLPFSVVHSWLKSEVCLKYFYRFLEILQFAELVIKTSVVRNHSSANPDSVSLLNMEKFSGYIWFTKAPQPYTKLLFGWFLVVLYQNYEVGDCFCKIGTKFAYTDTVFAAFLCPNMHVFLTSYWERLKISQMLIFWKGILHQLNLRRRYDLVA